MPTIRTYEVSLIPAKVGIGVFSFAIFDPATKKYKMQAASFAALESEIREKAHSDMRRTCAVLVSVPRGERKPAGFDKWRDSFRSVAVEDQAVTPALSEPASTNRPGDMAAVTHDETGLPYSTCLRMCNMD